MISQYFNHYFLNNKYTNWYLSLISKANLSLRQIDDKSYFELHHIIPKCIDKNLSNLKKHPFNGILLTAKEHYICHLLLTKMCLNKKHENKCIQAFLCMSRDINGNRYNSKTFSFLKTHMRYRHDEETKKKISDIHIGKPKSEEHKQKISCSKKDAEWSIETRNKMKNRKTRYGVKNKKPLSEERRLEISSTSLKLWKKETHRNKISGLKKGKTTGPFTEDRKRKIGLKSKGRKFSEKECIRRSDFLTQNNPMIDHNNRDKISKKLKGRKVINRDGKIKRVLPEKVDEFISFGWKLGAK